MTDDAMTNLRELNHNTGEHIFKWGDRPLLPASRRARAPRVVRTRIAAARAASARLGQPRGSERSPTAARREERWPSDGVRPWRFTIYRSADVVAPLRGPRLIFLPALPMANGPHDVPDDGSSTKSRARRKGQSDFSSLRLEISPGGLGLSE